MPNKDLHEKINETAKTITEKGCDYRSSLSLIKNNPWILDLNTSEVKNRLHLITNSNIIYAFIYVENNNYTWSLFENDEFGSFIKDDNYIIEMIIDSIEKYARVASLSDQTLEEKIKRLDNINQNSEGYHLK